MATFIGEFSCKLDEKGRTQLPSSFRSAMDQASTDRFIIKKDIFSPCLVIYPEQEWEKQAAYLQSKLNPYNSQHQQLRREIFKNIALVEMDKTGRILIPKRLLELAHIQKELFFAGQDTRIELWSAETYYSSSLNEQDFAKLAESILGQTE